MHLITPSLLITDDDRDFRETLRAVFEPRGYRTVLAADGAEALQILSQQRVHLALFDMHMPRVSGLEAMRRIRQAGEGSAVVPHLPCILLSAAVDETLIEEARKVEACAVLSKPIGVSDLTRAVQAALESNYRWPASLEPRR